MDDKETKKYTERLMRELTDRAAIHDVIARFAIGVDRRDWDMVASCFTPDAYFDSGPIFQGEIKQGILVFRENMKNFESTMHMTGTQLIELKEDKACAETYGIDYHRLNLGDRQKDIIVGLRFLDDLVRQDGKWLICKREVKFVWQREDAVVLPAGI